MVLYGRGDESQMIRVVPEPGMVLLFEHKINHDGELVTEGIKYTCRVSRVMSSMDPRAVLT